MLDSLRTLTDITTGDALLVSAADLRAERARQRLLEQARRTAKECVALAQDEAASIHAAAYRDGYLQGVLQAGNDLGELLLLEQGLAARLREDAAQMLRSMLEELCASDDWAPLLLQRWATDLQAPPHSALQVFLPARCKVSHGAMQAGLERSWDGPLHIEYHAQERLVFRLGERVLELDIPQVSERLAPRLALQLKSLRGAMHTLDDAGREALRAWLQGLVEPTDTSSQVSHDQ